MSSNIDFKSMPYPGYLANQDRGPEALVYNVIMTLVGTIAITLRIYARWTAPITDVKAPRFWWDDVAAIAAVPFMLGVHAIAFKMLQLGMGKHIWNIPPENISVALKYLFAIYISFDFALVLIRSSVLLFYSRIFHTSRSPTWFRMGIYILHAMNVAWFVGIILGSFLVCNPLAKYWNRMLPGQCGSNKALWLGHAAPSVALDILIVLLPQPLLWKLHLTRGRKLALSIVFLCGYLAVVTSAGRVAQVGLNAEKIEQDLSYEGVPAFYWLVADLPVSMLSICIPVMSHLGRNLYSACALAVKDTKEFFSTRWHRIRSRRAEYIPTSHDECPQLGWRLTLTRTDSLGSRVFGERVFEIHRGIEEVEDKV